MIKPLLLFSLLASMTLNAQKADSKPSKKTLKLQAEISNLIKKKALYSDSLDWQQMKIDESQLALTADATESEKILFDFYTGKLKAVGDKHSFFVTKDYMAKRAEKAPSQFPEGRYLGDGIACLKIPHCSNYDKQKDIDYAEKVRSDIYKLDSENTITGWIVDLRHNTGGNMWPMVAGLNALTEDGTAGYFIFNGSFKDPWIINNGHIPQINAPISDYKIKNKNVKIALLIDDYTASSGEMTAISFIGLPNVKTFGKNSAGYVTSNNTIDLSNGAKF